MYSTPDGGQITLCNWSHRLYLPQQRAASALEPIPHPLGIPARDAYLAQIRAQSEARATEEAEEAAERAAREQRWADERAEADARRAADAQKALDRAEYARAHLGPVLGVKLCELAEEERELRRALAEEKRAGQISGAVNLTELNSIGRALVDIETERTRIAREARRQRASEPRCDAAARASLACVGAAACQNAEQRMTAEAVPDALRLIAPE